MALTDNIVSYYKLDEATGDVVDSTENYNGTNYGATRGVSGKIEEAFSFNGSSDYVLTTHPLTSNPFSVSIWFKTDVNNASKAISQGVGTSGRERFSIRDYNGNLMIRQDRDSGGNLATGSTALSTDTWYHVVIVSNSAGFTAYLNNVEECSLVNADALYTGSNIGLVFGAGPRVADFFFSGDLDEVGIWDRELTEEEISELYNSGNGLSYPFTTPPDPDPTAAPTTSGTVQEGAGGIGTRYIAKRYPATEGLVAGSTKQTGTGILEEE